MEGSLGDEVSASEGEELQAIGDFDDPDSFLVPNDLLDIDRCSPINQSCFCVF